MQLYAMISCELQQTAALYYFLFLSKILQLSQTIFYCLHIHLIQSKFPAYYRFFQQAAK